MAEEQRTPPAVGAVLAALMRKAAPLAKRRRSVVAVSEAWCRVAGAEVASHTRISSVREGMVTIEVDATPLCHRLDSFEKERLLADLVREVRGAEVRGLRFRHGAF
jgi:predicted nucleic acid-binding Zn ribbon protein